MPGRLALDLDGWRASSAPYVRAEVRARAARDGSCEVSLELVEWAWRFTGEPWVWSLGGVEEGLRMSGWLPELDVVYDPTRVHVQ